MALELTGEEDRLDEAAGNGVGKLSRPGPVSLPVWLTILAVAVLVTGGATWMAVKPSVTDQATAPVPEFVQKTFGEQVIYNARFLPDGKVSYTAVPNSGTSPTFIFFREPPRRPAGSGPKGPPSCRFPPPGNSPS